MQKNFKMYMAAWAVALGVFDIIAILIPSEFGKVRSVFGIGYVSVVLAFIVQLVCAYKAFRAENLKKFFYNIPLINISYAGLILTSIVGILCMLIPQIPEWVGVIACVLILAITVVSLTEATAAEELIQETDKKIQTSTKFIKALSADAESLMKQVEDLEIKSEAKKVYEALYYSDPVSNDSLANMEAQIAMKFDVFSNAVQEKNFDTIKSVAGELLLLIDNRNKKCKLMK